MVCSCGYGHLFSGSLLSSFGGSAPLLGLSGLVPESDREEDRPIPPSRDKIALVGRGMCIITFQFFACLLMQK